MKIFGREPAAILAVLYSVIAVLGAFVFHLTIDQQSLLNAGAAASLGLVLAAMAHSDGLLAAVVGFAKAVMAIALGFGLHASPENQAIIMLAVSNIAAFFIVRPNITAPVPSNS